MLAMVLPRLLLIDDEPQLADFVANAGELCGYDPQIADGDEDFRAQFVGDRPAVVALDLGMPGSDGVELLRFLAEQAFTGPVLIISGLRPPRPRQRVPARRGARPAAWSARSKSRPGSKRSRTC